MSPIDDELRAALHGRAQVLVPSPDPLAGIERRARRIQRNRIAAAVAGSAVAVVVVAAVVPIIQTSATSQPDVPRVAGSSAPETARPVASRYVLDPDDPWRYRGDPDVPQNGNRETAAREWGLRHGLTEDQVTFTPLYGELYEPSQETTIVYLARGGGQTRWGVVQSSESGPEFLVDVELPEGARALPAALPGDEVARLLVVAAPDVGDIQYGPDAASEFTSMESIAEGVAVTPLEGDPATDAYRVLDREGAEVARGPAPDPAARDEGAGTVGGDEAAAYAFDPAQPWPFRGLEEVDGNIVVEDERLFHAAQPARSARNWTSTPLYYGNSDAGMHYLFVLHTAEGQEPVVTTTWQRGDRAHEQTEQGVEPGQKLIQAIVPTDLDDGSVMLVALASPKAGGIVLEQPDGNRPDSIGDPGVGLWLLEKGKRDGEIVLYTEGDGVEYYRNPVDVGPGAYDQ